MPTLDWLNRATAFNTAARVPYRLLEQVSVHTPTAAANPAPLPLRGEGGDEGLHPNAKPNQAPSHDNLLIQGDNLEALKALLPFYQGQVKCILDTTTKQKKEMPSLFNQNLLGTPKPERLLQRMLHTATHENDLVLDSYLGSGTTAAVAHKMRRGWIGIERGKQGGISKAVAWGVGRNGEPFRGGGFRFMRQGEAVFDESGRSNPTLRFATLAAFVWQQETGTAFDPLQAKPGTPYLGMHYEFNSCLRTSLLGQKPISFIKIPKFACYLLFNGILKDKRPASGNVLTQAVLDAPLALHAPRPSPPRRCWCMEKPAASGPSA